MDFRARLESALRDKYVIRRQAGEGGMAYVFEATDLKYDRTVALKVLKPEVATGLAAERFLREIQIVARLSHPHILPLYDSDEVDGALYYSMPFVAGESLRDRLARAPSLTIDEVLRIAREVGQALSYAHGMGVIHRDLKPANIMLSGGVAVVTDFGVARALSQAGSEHITHTGFAVGTPTYMSPEQGSGDATLDQRTDVYSLGCVVYEMLAGAPPFRADSALAMITQHIKAPPPDLVTSRSDVPVAIARAVTMALAKSPNDRFATVDDFIVSLESGVIRTPRAVVQQQRRAARRRAVAIAAVALGAAAVWWAGRRVTFGSPAPTDVGGPRVAVLAFDHQGPPDEQYFTDGVTDEISSRIADVRGIRVVSRASAMQFDLRRHPLREVSEKLGVQYVLVGAIRTERGPDGARRVRVAPRLVNVATERDIWRDTLDVELVPGAIFEVQSRIASQVAKALDIALSPEATEALAERPTTNLRAYSAYLRGNVHAIQALVRLEQLKAIESLQEAVQLDPQFALAYARLAQLEGGQYTVFDRTPSRLAEWKAALDRAVALAPKHPQTRLAQGQWATYAMQNVDSAFRIFAELRAQQPNNSELIWYLGRAQRVRGDFTGALASFTEAAALDPRSTRYPFEACTVLWRLQRFDEGLAQLDRAASLDPDWLLPKTSRAQFLLASGRVDEARKNVEGLLTQLAPADLVVHYVSDPLYRLLWETVLPPPYDAELERLSLTSARVDSAEYYRAKARLYARRGQTAREGAYFDSARVVLEGRRNAGATGLFLHTDLGAAYAALGRSDEARAQADTAARAGLLRADAFRGWFAMVEIARVYASLHAPNDALAILQSLTGANAVPPAWLRLDPAFADLRADPRYQALLGTPR